MTGRYRLVESIGQGGMGRVWRAADEMLDRQVAVKEMRIDGLDAEDTRTRRERTLREARATARIDHPNVVRVYDVVDEGERLWIVMELVNGRSLERMTVEDGPLGPRETALLGLGLVQALRQVHARGVLHRDIKPGNVLVESADRAGHRIVLTDFGIAAMQDAKALTMVGMLVGSPDYMAPERVSGRPQGPPSDIWSLGATLCAALGGRSPFSRDTTLATLHAVLYEEPELPAAAGPLTDILAALLEKDPSIRPSLDDVESALHTVAFPAPTPTLRMGTGDDAGTPEPAERRGPTQAADEANEQRPTEGRGRDDAAGAARGLVAEEGEEWARRQGDPGRVDPAGPAVAGRADPVRSVGPGWDDGAGAARGPVAGEEGDRESWPGDPGRVDPAGAPGAGGVDPAGAPGAGRGESARAAFAGRADPVRLAGPGRDDGAGAARGPVAGEEGDRESWPGDPGRVDPAGAPGAGGVDPAGASGAGRGESARAAFAGRADPVRLAGPGWDDGAGAARGPVAGEEGDRESWPGDPGRVDPAGAPGAGGVESARAPGAGQEDSARASGVGHGESAPAPAAGRADPAQAAGAGRDDGAQTSGTAPGSERVRSVRDPRVPQSETGPATAVREPAVAEPSDAVPVGHAFPGAAGDEGSGTPSDGAQPVTEVAGAAAGESVREPAVAEPSDAVPPGFAPSGGAGDEGSGRPPDGFPAVAEVVAAQPELPTSAEPFSIDRVASASTEAASEERSEVRSETPSGSAVGAVLRAGATTAGTPLASAPTQDSLSAGAPTEHFPMPDAPTRDTPTRAASAPTRVGPVPATHRGSGPGVSLVRGKQAVPDQHPDPGPTSGSGATSTTAGTGSPDSAAHTDGPAANLRTDPDRTDPSSTDPGPGADPQPHTGQDPDPAPALILGPHPHRMHPGEPPGPARPATRHRDRRRTALVAAGSMVAAGAAVVAIILATTSGSPGDDKAGGSPSASGSASVSAPESGASTPAGTPSSTVEGTSRPRSLPPGAHEEAGGFAWATPTGWRRDVKTGAEVHYTSPDGKQELAAKSSLARGDLMETWRTSEQNAHQGQAYAKIRLEETTFRDHPAVVWEYTFTLDGIPWHAQLLGFNVGDKSYQINTWYQPDTKTQALRTYEKVKDSFTVL
ncbi:protein kinase [Streptomyces sp. SAI-144]|uniref:protein kinase domain-containing protein n=1 Tax=Streptomyces sp. SAI-144 TaxID=2940544 RepID=UPI002474BE54|nr:protein kinase [Streptomyces sp. SAI-144]